MEVITSPAEPVAVDSLTPHPENPRRGDIDAIRESIRENGWYGAVVAQRSTGRILVGEHRWRSAKAEGAETVDVQWADVDDDTALRIMLLDNRTNDVADYEPSRLLDALSALDGKLAGSGYEPADVDDLQSMLARLNTPPAPPAEQPDAPTRQVQGLHEVILIMQEDRWQEYQELVLRLRRKWSQDVTPLLVLRALREAVAGLPS